jgi:hypothetical protein
MVGDTLETSLRSNKRLEAIIAHANSSAEALEDLFILALSRKPTKTEQNALLTFIESTPQEKEVYEDLFWSLLNSTEFSFNH